MIEIQKDKWYHFGCSGLIGLFFGIMFMLLQMSAIQIFIAAFFAILNTGFGKEYGDYNNPRSGWDWKDIIADAIGAFLGAGCIAILKLM